MATQEEVNHFLNDFKTKYKIFSILFRDNRQKNTTALLTLDITPNKRKEIIEDIKVEDFSEGPIDDKIYGLQSMWVFGKNVKGIEVYIKITLGAYNREVICISFHDSESPMNYPFKKQKT